MKKLAKKDPEKERELAHRIKAAGIPISTGSAEQDSPALLIRQDCEQYDSEIFEVNGGAGLVLPLKIVPNSSVFVFSGFYVELDRCRNLWLRPLEEVETSDWPRYEFCGRSELKFNRDEVINRFITERKAFHRGHALCGLLLAFSSTPMPDDIRRGEILEGKVLIYDQFERRHSANIRLRAERETAPVLRSVTESGTC